MSNEYFNPLRKSALMDCDRVNARSLLCLPNTGQNQELPSSFNSGLTSAKPHDVLCPKLMMESAGIFERLNTEAKYRCDSLSIDELLTYSRLYRSCLRSSQMSVAASPSDSGVVQGYLAEAELVWTLCELLFVQSDARSLALELADWAMLSFARYSDWAQTLLKDTNALKQQTNLYWDTLYSLVCIGRLKEAVSVLSQHNHHHSHHALFVALEQFLIKAPFHALNSTNDDEAGSDWVLWQNEGKRMAEDGSLQANEHLHRLLRIVCGDPTALSEVTSVQSEVLQSWYEAVVPLLLYAVPMTTLSELSDTVRYAKKLVDPALNREETKLEQVVQHLFELDVLSALKVLAENSADWWLPAHLADLLVKTVPDLLVVPMSAQQPQPISDLRSYLILEYAQSLARQQAYWLQSVPYLLSCGLAGRRTLELCLQRMPLNNHKRTLQLLCVARKENLSALATSICKQLVQTALANDQLHTALGWSLQSQDASLICLVAERMLYECGQLGINRCLSLIRHIDPKAALSSAPLLFLTKYRELYDLRKLNAESSTEQRTRGNLTAGALLVQLLTHRVAPRYFWKILFNDAINMLMDTKTSTTAFTRDQTFELLNCLEQSLITHDKIDTKETEHRDALRLLLLDRLMLFV